MYRQEHKNCLNSLLSWTLTSLWQDVNFVRDTLSSLIQETFNNNVNQTTVISYHSLLFDFSTTTQCFGTYTTTILTSSYATMVHGRGCNPHRSTTTFANVEITSLWHHWWRHNLESTRERQKRRPPRAMKSSELSDGENRITLRQLLQNRKLRHLWRHNLGSRWKLQKKMAWENFSIGVFYNITKDQDNPIKTIRRDKPQNP